jgi:hypothetical protein
MTRKQIGAVLGAVVLAVAAPILTLALLNGLDGKSEAAPAAVPMGACCTGGPPCDCVITLGFDECDLMDGIYLGDGSSCGQIEACCEPGGACYDCDSACCAALVGVDQGPATMCTATEACCYPDNSCTDTDVICCDDFGGVPQGTGTDCSPNPCGAAMTDPHYKCYDILGQSPPVNEVVTLEDQFGTQVVMVTDPYNLCAPAVKYQDGAPAGGSLTNPHLKSYLISGGHDPDELVNLTSQFGSWEHVEVENAVALWVPTLKEVVSPDPVEPPPGPVPSEPHYVCYNITVTDIPPGLDLELETQFGREPWELGAGWQLCAPALKNEQGNLDEPHLMCFNDTVRDFPPHVVNLETQFLYEEGMAIGAGLGGFMGCVPVDKEPVATADVKIISQEILAEDCASPPPTEIPVGEDVVICVEKILHNNGPEGPAPTNIDKSTDPVGPCTIDPPFHSDQVLLPTSTALAHIEYFTINCSAVGAGYAFYITNDIDVKPPDWIDPDLVDNGAWSELIVDTLPAADLEKADLYVKPFYCGDTDLDGDEATGARVPVGLGTCCDGWDNDGDTVTDGQDPKCHAHINEDPPGDGDDDGDGYDGEDPPSYGAQSCPWNGDDDCDTLVDEDPKNGWDDDGDYLLGPFDFCLPGYGAEYGCDEDPANGFLGIDNDRDGAVDEDGSGRFDWNGDTVIDEVQEEGIDDDGDTSVDEDPLDSVLLTEETGIVHEPHYLIKELLLNHGPTSQVVAEDITEVDAPGWLANAKEDGFTTCTDNLDNDGDFWVDALDDDCLDPHIGEEAAGLHACNDGLDNGDGWNLGGGQDMGDDLIDEGDDDCFTWTEVSVECESADDVITIKDGVNWGFKPPQNSPLVEANCPEMYSAAHTNKCVPCGIYGGVGPVADTCGNLLLPHTPYGPGHCILAFSQPGVMKEKELDFHKYVSLNNVPGYMMTPISPWPPGDPTGTLWQGPMAVVWQVTGWNDNGDGELSMSDEIGMINTGTLQVVLFHVDGTMAPDFMALTENGILTEHQYDLACLWNPSLHKFTIQNELVMPDGIIDPVPGNNFGEMEMAVACTAYTDGILTDLTGPSTPWTVDVSTGVMQPVTVNATNSESTTADFTVTLEAQSPGLGIDGPSGMADTDGDGWADNVEGMLASNKDADWITPESLHTVPDTCNDGVDNDQAWGMDAADIKCKDTDGDGFSDGEEFIYGPPWLPGEVPMFLDPDRTPEHMQFPWTCDDDVDNDGDARCDDAGCTAYPGLAEGDSGDTDTEDDCDIHQLGGVRPPAMCASGWQSSPGATYGVTVAGNGDLSVAINIPVTSLAPAETRSVAGGLVFHCFAPAAPYPTQAILASIEPANPHVIDLRDSAPLLHEFDGNATCAANADLVVEDWVFTPAPSPILPLDEWEGWSTDKVILNDGPSDAPNVRVRKWMNVPEDCQGYVRVAYAGEKVEIAQLTEYQINDTGWLVGPVTLVEPTDVSIGDYVYLKGSSSLDETTSEVFAIIDLPDPILNGEYGHAVEDFGVMCEQAGDHPFFFGNQVTHADFPATCDPTLANISMDIVVQARARDCTVTSDTDGDTFPDDDECYLPTDPLDDCTDLPGDVDAWPLDNNVDTFVTVVGDVLTYSGNIGLPVTNPTLQRLDLNADGSITVVGDVLAFSGMIGASCP